MVLEIEVKAYCDDLNHVEEILKEKGAQFIEEVTEIDTYYSHPVRDFAETDEALRIRLCGEKSYITYKGPKIDALSKTREEIEIEVTDADAAKQLLVILGFHPVAEVKKVRRLYRLSPFDICLDDVENVGTFVEVETLGESVAELRDAALTLLKEFNLEHFERKSYLELLLLNTG